MINNYTKQATQYIHISHFDHSLAFSNQGQFSWRPPVSSQQEATSSEPAWPAKNFQKKKKRKKKSAEEKIFMENGQLTRRKRTLSLFPLSHELTSSHSLHHHHKQISSHLLR